MRNFVALLPIAWLLTACGGNINTKPVSDGSNGSDGSASGCVTHTECTSGLCVDGQCCPSGEQVCGDRCCAADQVCFANACVLPGKICYSVGDCSAGQYCEPSLGPPGDDPGDPPQEGQVCVLPPPEPGRCLDLPPRCEDNAAAADCLPACEVYPEGEQLTASAEWRWGEGTAKQYPSFVDLWATPTVGRVTDSNCDGKVNELDPPNVIFVSGDARGTCCSCGGYEPSTCRTGVLRALDGGSGEEIWSLQRPSADSIGFAGLSVAIGDVDGDGLMEIVAMTGEGRFALVDNRGQIEAVSDELVAGSDAKNFGWGGGIAMADMDGDGLVEVAYAGTVATISGVGFETRFSKTGSYLSTFVDLDQAPDGQLELLAGQFAYRSDGSLLWKAEVGGLPGVGDFNGDGKPEAVLVSGGKVWLVNGEDGSTRAGPLKLPGTGGGGPPTVADFDGDGRVEIGVAQANFYTVVKPSADATKLSMLWKTPNHDLSSSVTGSTVFDFEGDGSAEVIYNDECFLWVYDGKTGAVRFATPTTSFTATEASVVADVDGDGRAEMLMIANGADPSEKGWKCNIAPWNKPDPALRRPAWKPPEGATAYRGLTLWGDGKLNRWVGTRTLWNQHTYHVSNVCDSRDSACEGANNSYGAIPQRERRNWTVPWLNNFRQNVQDAGLFDAPDAAVTLRVPCASPIELSATLRNLGLALLPAGVEVAFFVRGPQGDVELGRALTPTPLFPGQAVELRYSTTPQDAVGVEDVFVARIINDPASPSFIECRDDNNASQPRSSPCVLK